MSGRYRLLKSDLDALKEDGARQGERSALEHRRWDAEFDDYLSLSAAEYIVANTLYRYGVSWDRLSTTAKASAMVAWNDGYRDGYAAAFYEDD